MSLFGTGRREGILAALVLVVLAVVQHAPGLFFGRPRAAIDLAHATAHELARESSTNQTILVPAMRQAGEVVRSGALPTWNPFARLGEPFVATGAPTLYPPFWILAVPGGEGLLDLVLCLHTALGCVLAYRMLRTLSASRYSAFVAGGIYGLGWTMTVALDRLPEAAAAAWLPLAVEATWRCLFEHRRARSATLLGVSLAILFSTGGTATAFLSAGLVVTALATGLLAINRVDRFRAMRAVGTGLVLCTALTAPLWVGALEHRSLLLGPAGPQSPGVPALTLAGIFAPGLFGELKTTASALHAATDGIDPIAFAVYPGALTLFVALLGLLRPKRTRQSLFWVAIAGISLVLATRGEVGDCFRRLTALLPYRPGTELALFQLAVCVLCALALESFFDAPRSRRIAVPIAAGTVLSLSLGALVAFVLAPQLGRSIAAAFLGIDVHQFAPAHASDVMFAVLSPMLAGSGIAISFLIWRRLGILRFKTLLAAVSLGEVVVLALWSVPRSHDHSAPIDVASSIGGGRVMRTGIDPRGSAAAWAGRSGARAIDTEGNSILSRTRRVLDGLEPDMVQLDGHARVGGLRVAALLSEPFREVLALTAVIGDESPSGFDALLAAPGGTGSARAMVHAANTPVPRARIAFSVVHADTPRDAARFMTSAPRRTADSVVLEGDLGEFVPRQPATPTPIEWLHDGADHVALRVEMGDGRGYLVLSDAMAPGWNCKVDGESTPILAADVATRAVALREGAHEVVFSYSPMALRYGTPLGLLGVLFAVGLLVWDRVRRGPIRPARSCKPRRQPLQA